MMWGSCFLRGQQPQATALLFTDAKCVNGMLYVKKQKIEKTQKKVCFQKNAVKIVLFMVKLYKFIIKERFLRNKKKIFQECRDSTL